MLLISTITYKGCQKWSLDGALRLKHKAALKSWSELSGDMDDRGAAFNEPGKLWVGQFLGHR